MSDLFHEDIDPQDLDLVFEYMLNASFPKIEEPVD